MGTVLSKIALAASVVLLLSCTPKSTNNDLAPTMAVEVNPPPIYNQWLGEVEGCVLYMAQFDTTFKVVKLYNDASELKWIILSSERDNGTIPCIKDGVEHSCFALSHPDTIVLSAQYARSMPVVKHELMHQIVDAPGEAVLGPHGAPWGMCEYLW
jgi:hypothetical protein